MFKDKVRSFRFRMRSLPDTKIFDEHCVIAHFCNVKSLSDIMSGSSNVYTGHSSVSTGHCLMSGSYFRAC